MKWSFLPAGLRMVYMAEKFFVESQEAVHIFRICKLIIWQGGPEFLPNHKKMQTNLAVRPCLAGPGESMGKAEETGAKPAVLWDGRNP